MVIVSSLGIFVAAVAVLVIAWLTERALRRLSLALVILGVLMIVGAERGAATVVVLLLLLTSAFPT